MLLEHLRAGDLRCVRTTVSSVTARRRREPQALASIDGILSELRDSFDPHGVDISLPPQQRAFAAELVALLAIDDSPMRARLGNSPGVVRALVGLVDEAWRYAAAIDPNVTNPSAATERFLGAEAAAEALWILSFNSPSNHAALVAGGAVQALAGALTARDAFGVQTPARMSMWAAAALHSLSASYCASADGRCLWRWQQGAAVALAPTSALNLDAAQTRTLIGQQPRVLEVLVRHSCVTSTLHASAHHSAAPSPQVLVRHSCDGPVGASALEAGSSGPWPSRALRSSRLEPSIVPWAAAGALQSLALDTTLAERLRAYPNTRRCLCALSRSPDWLESSSALGALHHLRQGCEDETGSEDGVSSAPIRMTTVASGAVVSAVARAARERAREQPVWAGDEPGDGPPAGVYAGRAR